MLFNKRKNDGLRENILVQEFKEKRDSMNMRSIEIFDNINQYTNFIKFNKVPQNFVKGDIIIIQPFSGFYVVGIVLKNNIENLTNKSLNNHYVIIFTNQYLNEYTEKINLNLEVKTDNSITRPMIVNDDLLNSGYIYRITNMKLTSKECKLSYGFLRTINNKFYTEDGYLMKYVPSIRGSYVVATEDSVFAEVLRGILIDANKSKSTEILKLFYKTKEKRIVEEENIINLNIVDLIQQRKIMEDYSQSSNYNLCGNGYEIEQYLRFFIAKKKLNFSGKIIFDTSAQDVIIILESNKDKEEIEKIISEKLMNVDVFKKNIHKISFED